MNKYNIIVEKEDYILIALNTIYDFTDVITEIETKLKQLNFSGYLIFDYLLYCVSHDSIDRFCGYKVNQGKIIKNERLVFVESLFSLKEKGDEHFKNINKQVIDNSQLSEESKKWFFWDLQSIK